MIDFLTNILANAPPLKDVQPLVGAAIGFTGVIITLSVNARLARRSIARETQKQKTSVLAAFYAELANMVAIIAQANLYASEKKISVFSGAKMETKSLYFFQSVPRTIYEKNVDKLGLLGRDITYAVVTAYISTFEFENLISSAPTQSGSKMTAKFIHDEDIDLAEYFAGRALHYVKEAIIAVKAAIPKRERGNMPDWAIPYPHPTFSRSYLLPPSSEDIPHSSKL